MNSNQKGPLKPDELFRRLMAADFKESECIDEVAKIQQQREILIQLIIEYENQIKNINLVSIEEQDLLQYRQKLISQLDILRSQRNLMETRIRQEIQSLRVTPVELKDHAELIAEIDLTRARNNKLKLKIQDLVEYIRKLQFKNKKLQQERRVLEMNEVQRIQAGENWRWQVENLQREHISYEYQLRKKLKDKEEAALRNVQAQQLQIKQRNRKRMQSFKSSQHSTPYNKIDNRNSMLEGHYFRKI